MGIDATEMYLIPACSWHRPQRGPGDRAKIGLADVEASAIKFWNRQHPLLVFLPPPPILASDFMSSDAPETYPIPACSWHRAQRRSGHRFKIGLVALAESAIEFWYRQHLLLALPGPPPRVDRDFRSIDAPEMYLILALRLRRALQPPSVRFGIGSVVVVEYYVGCPGIFVLWVMIRQHFVGLRLRLNPEKHQ